VVLTLQPHPDGTLSGETVRASTDSSCSAKRTVKFTRSGDPDLNKVPDPAVLPPRVVTLADALGGSYRQTTTFTNGNVVPATVLAVNTYCLRTGDRCMSLFHGSDGAVTLMFADDKWTRHEEGTTTCAAGGTAQVTITAEYPLPKRWTTRSRCSPGVAVKPLPQEAGAPEAATSRTNSSAPAIR
jgi:serine/threonine-protein kinase